MAESVDNYHTQRQSHNTTATYYPFVTFSGVCVCVCGGGGGVAEGQSLHSDQRYQCPKCSFNKRSISASLEASYQQQQAGSIFFNLTEKEGRCEKLIKV